MKTFKLRVPVYLTIEVDAHSEQDAIHEVTQAFNPVRHIDCLAGTNIEFDNPRAQNGVIKTCEFTDDEQDIEIE